MDKKMDINVVVIGPFGSGKSTTAGHLIKKCQGVKILALEQLGKEAKELGKDLKYAWILDRSEGERKRGMTVDIALWKFETRRYFVTVINVPGRRDYIKKTITGMFVADCAILIIAAGTDEFEAGVSEDEQTREQALFAYSFGVKQLIVAINKMDESKWSEDRFLKIIEKTSKIIEDVGYNPKTVAFVPISGLNGDNLFDLSSKASWYQGRTLLGAIDAFEPPSYPTDKAPRPSLHGVYEISDIGTIAVGRVETGIITAGMSVIFAPANITDPPEGAESFTAQVLVLKHPDQIEAGYTSVVECYTAQIACKFTEIIAKIDQRTGISIENNPKFIKSGDTAIVKMMPSESMCVERFTDCPLLGWFVVYDTEQTVIVGFIKSVVKADKAPYSLTTSP